MISGDRDSVKKFSMMSEVCGVKMMALMMVAMAGVGARAQVLSPATAGATQTTAAVPHATAPADPFPPVNLKNFNADSPSTAEVNAFLKQVWGYDDTRIWKVAAIRKTQAPGVVQVVVLAADTIHPEKVTRNEFFITPDGKHAIVGGVVDFGATPFLARREMMQREATGPAEGAAGKELLLVLFTDLLNGRSKDAQDVANNLLKDIPQARLVVESFPADGSPYAFHTAAEGVCVRKAKGDAAYFAYSEQVYSTAKGLTATTLQPALDAAVQAAGADAKSVSTCSVTPETKAEVEASIALAGKAGVDATPLLVVNGRVLPPSDISYDMLKRIVAYQAQLDGVAVKVQPTLSNLK
jgi:protein-disulfide isomerase